MCDFQEKDVPVKGAVGEDAAASSLDASVNIGERNVKDVIALAAVMLDVAAQAEEQVNGRMVGVDVLYSMSNEMRWRSYQLVSNILCDVMDK